MRLNRRRRRSLHDLDIGNVQTTNFAESLPDTDSETNDWVNALLTDRERAERLHRRLQHQQAVRETPATRNIDVGTAAAEAALDLSAYPPPGRSRRTQNQPGWPNMDGQITPPAPRRIVGHARDTLQLNERVPMAVIQRHRDPQEALRIIEDRLKRRMMDHIQYQWPGSMSDWEYAFDISSDTHNEETNITLTARRP